MRKLTLNVEVLRIEQFEIEVRNEGDRGTVIGHGRYAMTSLYCSPSEPYACPNMTASEIRVCG